jgi:hypothetical protein
VPSSLHVGEDAAILLRDFHVCFIFELSIALPHTPEEVLYGRFFGWDFALPTLELFDSPRWLDGLLHLRFGHFDVHGHRDFYFPALV